MICRLDRVSMNLVAGLMAVALVACASQPAVLPPVAVAQAHAHAVAAMRAAQKSAWADSAAQWQEALALSASIDDWAGQGEARLGLANAETELHRRDLAQQVVAAMPTQTLYPQQQRARAAYQMALLALPDTALANQSLAQAQQLCATPCGMQPWLDNLSARIALMAGDAPRAQSLAQSVTAQAAAPGAERAHAWRLLAEAQLLQGQALAASASLRSALQIDHELAVPAWLADDFALQARIGAALAQPQVITDAHVRLRSLCAAASAAACVSLPSD